MFFISIKTVYSSFLFNVTKMDKKTSRFLIITSVSMLSAGLMPTIFKSFTEASYIVSIGGYVLIIVSILLACIVFYKEYRAKKILSSAVRKDPIWDLNELKIGARSVFYRVHNALVNQDPLSMKDYSTEGFYKLFSKKIATLKGKESSPADNANIEETRIVCCQDYLNNEKDKYVAYIKGNFTDDSTILNFSEMYHFVRVGNDWLLNDIDHTSGYLKILFTRNIEEE